MQDHLKRHLLGVFLCAMHYNSTETVNYLEQKGITKNLLDELFTLAPTFKNTYERKLFVIGLI